jgi:hypothetical protein
MAIREEAPRNHDALFPNHVSTLKVTDPELIELFDNWAFDEVLKDGILDTRTRDDTMTNVLILGANGQLARHATRVFLRDTDAKLTLYLRRASR